MAKITFLLGSGASASFGLPTMVDLTKRAESISPFVTEIRKSLESFNFISDIETVLTVLNDFNKGQALIKELGPSLLLFIDKPELLIERSERFFSVLVPNKGKETALYLFSQYLNEEVDKIKQVIWDACTLPANSQKIKEASELYHDLFSNLSYKRHIKAANDASSGDLDIDVYEGKGMPDIFTTNYDLLIERVCEMLKIPCSRGVSPRGGALGEEIYDPDSIEKTYSKLKLYKLHGSLDFYIVGDEIKRLPVPPRVRFDASGSEIREELMIYPMHAKYVYSYPYYSLFRQFYENLIKSQVLVIIGHSMRDQAINDILTAAMIKNDSLAIIMVNIKPEDVYFLKTENNFLSRDKIKARTQVISEPFGTSICIQSILYALSGE